MAKDGLFDLRKPPHEAPMTKACHDLLTGAQLGNPQLTVEEALKVWTAGVIRQLPSVPTVRRLSRNADTRRRYYEQISPSEDGTKQETTKAERVEVEELELGGGELLKAADLETGTVAALTTVAMDLGKKLKADSGELERQAALVQWLLAPGYEINNRASDLVSPRLSTVLCSSRSQRNLFWSQGKKPSPII